MIRKDYTIRAGKVALVVGTALNAINQGDLLLGAPMTLGRGAQMILTFLVPFLVSLHGQLSSSPKPDPQAPGGHQPPSGG
ncbi:nitrate/nitrite transporter NrtS [Thiohalorhabdus methylotrophus]|uniref:Nitrate/nitrite transporter NrtS n=1 Tax=Thiohalorhabdus methylotrophus TaxID=3242694 RepID=A0ABV4TY93_9GAMM